MLQYAHGNEPSHHVAYLYNFVGNFKKTQWLVKEILNIMYDATPAGISGNEDCGQMSAWYILSCLGFYPVNPASSIYHIGRPAFDLVVIDLPPNVHNMWRRGTTFTISAPGAGSQDLTYISKTYLNGQEIPMVSGNFTISYQNIMKGGELRFSMMSKEEEDRAGNPWYPQSTF